MCKVLSSTYHTGLPTLTGAIKCVRNFVPPATLKSISQNLIQPYFDYCSVVWGNCGLMHNVRWNLYLFKYNTISFYADEFFCG